MITKLSQDELKMQVAVAAIAEIQPWLDRDAVLGIGTGSTADLFIDQLASHKGRFRAAVASSERSARRLSGHGIPVLDLNEVEDLPVYVDGADEITQDLAMIKGGGGALTREKIVAAVARQFVCIADASKMVPALGRFPLPIEVIPMARAHVARSLAALLPGIQAGSVRLRGMADGQSFVTDNGNLILDVHGLDIEDPAGLESLIDGIAGVVTNGLFARRGADVLLLGTEDGVQRLKR